MIKKSMNFLFVSGVFVSIVLVSYTIWLFHNIGTSNTYELSEEVGRSGLFESGNIKWLSRNNNFTENKKGWIGNGILVDHEGIPPNAAIYMYYPNKGERQLIASCGNYYGKFMGSLNIVPYVLNQEKILFHYNYVDNIVLKMELNNINKKEYSYIEDTVPEDNILRKYIEEYPQESDRKEMDSKSSIRIYDIVSNKSEIIFEYKTKYRSVPNTVESPIENFQSLGYSNNSRYVCWTIEKEPGVFEFFVYDLALKTTKVYDFTENQGGVNLIENLTVSNDGNTVWFMVKPLDMNSLKDFRPEKYLCRLCLNNNEPVKAIIAQDVVSYKISYDNRYIIYDTFLKDKDKSSSSLKCIDLLSGKLIDIDKDSIECLVQGYDLSPSTNKFAYLKKNHTGAELYIGEIEEENIILKSVCKLQDIYSVDCVDFSYDNKKMLISYYYLKNKVGIYDTCVVDIN